MIVAPDVFTVTDGTYAPTVEVDWVAFHGEPSPLYIGRTLRYTTADGWTVGPATANAKRIWKPLAKAAKTIRSAFDAAGAAEDPREGYYELIGPGLADNPHQLDAGTFRVVGHGQGVFDEILPRTSLYAMRNWMAATDYAGVLWTRTGEDGKTQYAAVRRSLLLP